MMFATVDDLQVVAPDIDVGRAVQLLELASSVVAAWIQSRLGRAIEEGDPVPDQVRVATIIMAHRMHTLGGRGDIVSASIDDASYRYQRATTVAEALVIDDLVGDLLADAWGVSSGLGTIRTMSGLT